MQGFLQVENVSFFYGHAQVLRDVSLSVPKGSVLCILGKSGTGKSTLLRVIAGILRPSAGRILVDGRDITTVNMHERRELGYVFQSGEGLFPHLSVYQNVAFPFLQGKRSLPGKPLWQSAVTDMLDYVGLVEKKKSMLWELSGGMAQRVALARSLVYEPDILLLDEPLGSLDNALKAELTDLLRSLQTRLGTTFVYVTHDEREALAFGSHIAVINGGQIEQEGEIETLTSRPKTETVARLIGGWNILDYRETGEGSLGDDEKALLAAVNHRDGAAGEDTIRLIGIPVSRTAVDRRGSGQTCATNVVNIEVNVLRVQAWYNQKQAVTQTESGKKITATVPISASLKTGDSATLSVGKEDIHAFYE